eukprot:5376173-Pyramimonas_sp.AAC.1
MQSLATATTPTIAVLPGCAERQERVVEANHKYDLGRLSSCVDTRACPVSPRHVGGSECEKEIPEYWGRVPLGNPTITRPTLR